MTSAFRDACSEHGWADVSWTRRVAHRSAIVVRLGGRRIEAPGISAQSTCGEVHLAVLLHVAGLIDTFGSQIAPDAEALVRLPWSGVPEAACEFRLCKQFAHLRPEGPLPPGQPLVLDLRQRSGSGAARCGSRRADGDCKRCADLASLHALTARWRSMKEAAKLREELALSTQNAQPLVVNIRFSGTRAAAATLALGGAEDARTVAAALAAFSLRLEAGLRFGPTCGRCRSHAHCEVHVQELRHELLPLGLPRCTCRLQLWDGLVRVEPIAAPLAQFASLRGGPLRLVAKEGSGGPACDGRCCLRCAEIAEADPDTCALRRRRHFWGRKRQAFLIRRRAAGERCSALGVFLADVCPPDVFRAVVMFL